MKKISYYVETLIPKYLSKVSYIFLIFIALIISVQLVRELYDLVSLTFSFKSGQMYYEILENILSFFIFFEFLTLIITSIKNRGHVSLIFLLSLGITSLIRVLLTNHDSFIELLIISVSILLLIIGCILLQRFMPSSENK